MCVCQVFLSAWWHYQFAIHGKILIDDLNERNPLTRDYSSSGGGARARIIQTWETFICMWPEWLRKHIRENIVCEFARDMFERVFMFVNCVCVLTSLGVIYVRVHVLWSDMYTCLLMTQCVRVHMFTHWRFEWKEPWENSFACGQNDYEHTFARTLYVSLQVTCVCVCTCLRVDCVCAYIFRSDLCACACV